MNIYPDWIGPVDIGGVGNPAVPIVAILARQVGGIAMVNYLRGDIPPALARPSFVPARTTVEIQSSYVTSSTAMLSGVSVVVGKFPVTIQAHYA